MPRSSMRGVARHLAAALSLACAVLCLAPASASAHEFRPTVLRVDLGDAGEHAVLWKWDGLDPRGVSADTLSFGACTAEVHHADDGTERMAHFQLQCGDAPLVVTFPEPISEIILDLRHNGVPQRVSRLTHLDLSLDLSAMVQPADAPAPSVVTALPAWIVIGAEHIVFGPDHLAFVLALTLLVGRWRRIAVVVTGFTLGHTVTLSGAALGWLPEPSSAPVEAVIALSITYLAVELTRGDDARHTFSHRLGVFVAVGFGLVHGFGFAGALSDIGLPPGDELLALGGFNLGVELGQIAFVAIVLLIATAIQRIRGAAEPFPRPVRLAGAYWLGAVSICWLLQRSSAILL